MLDPHRNLGVLKSLGTVDPLQRCLAQHGVQPARPQGRVSVPERLHESAQRLVTPAEVPHVEDGPEGVDLEEANIKGVPKTLLRALELVFRSTSRFVCSGSVVKVKVGSP